LGLVLAFGLWGAPVAPLVFGFDGGLFLASLKELIRSQASLVEEVDSLR